MEMAKVHIQLLIILIPKPDNDSRTRRIIIGPFVIAYI